MVFVLVFALCSSGTATSSCMFGWNQTSELADLPMLDLHRVAADRAHVARVRLERLRADLASSFDGPAGGGDETRDIAPERRMTQATLTPGMRGALLFGLLPADGPARAGRVRARPGVPPGALLRSRACRRW
jgi:hypothetical protein